MESQSPPYVIRLRNENHPQAHNVHFHDEEAGGKLAFDYRLRRGSSPTTNALKILEIEGLPVDGKELSSLLLV